MISDADRDMMLSRIRDVPDWPKPGVTFKDITPLLRDAPAFARVIELLSDAGPETGEPVTAASPPVDLVIGIEARGFILGAPVAHRLGAGFVPVRKEGKLPAETTTANYELEYGEETVEVHRDAVAPGQRVLIVDDVLATGGTVSATVELMRAAGAEIVGVNVLLELGFLHGRDRLADVHLDALLTV
ncbi:adenine phosphoribosyltransferase [Actinobacteria bacterium YIM 96077]|uniref:Adenine phosphoribosyltransferase n=1 Tax=Phytoactinopolyspora halophila TaxID=1981511 RepID=A0A329QEQ4_9ACTN|nr:adenine phosphoribosyltransferase [Phytoactinopolyspora halophila]AYY13464.1 adenine phosphoribosyltransferase [Actinobacteria bacterium YIM 96077]RAW10857.1 adenine phosphoribosyltransferase [Phytoactinopolyspora halophila]